MIKRLLFKNIIVILDLYNYKMYTHRFNNQNSDELYEYLDYEYIKYAFINISQYELLEYGVSREEYENIIKNLRCIINKYEFTA